MEPFLDLLAPFGCDDFFRDHWAKRSLKIEGHDEKWKRLPGLERLPMLLAGKLDAERWAPAHAGAAGASFLDRDGAYRSFSATSSTWPEMYNAGISLCFGPLDRADDELARLVSSFRKSSTHAGKIVTTCYLTPPSSGSSMHFDRQHVFFLQVSGEKHWTYGALPAWVDPPLSIDAELLESPALEAQLAALGVPPIARPAQTQLQKTVLRPGDVLYLPPGAWHEAHTVDRHSLHYTLTFEPMTSWTLMYAFLRLQLLKQPIWRRDLRYSTESGGPPAKEILLEALDALRAAVANAKPEELAPFYAMVSDSEGPVREYFSAKT